MMTLKSIMPGSRAIVRQLTGRGNVKPDRLGLRGETRLTASGIYAGRGGVDGCGIVEIEDRQAGGLG